MSKEVTIESGWQCIDCGKIVTGENWPQTCANCGCADSYVSVELEAGDTDEQPWDFGPDPDGVGE